MITIKQAREMKTLYQAGWSQDWIAERLGVAQSTVHYHRAASYPRPPCTTANRAVNGPSNTFTAFDGPVDFAPVNIVFAGGLALAGSILTRAAIRDCLHGAS